MLNYKRVSIRIYHPRYAASHMYLFSVRSGILWEMALCRSIKVPQVLVVKQTISETLICWNGSLYGCVSKPIIYHHLSMLVEWTPINPSYFDVNKRATFGFDPKPYLQFVMFGTMLTAYMFTSQTWNMTFPYPIEVQDPPEWWVCFSSPRVSVDIGNKLPMEAGL